ncbi:MAG TPA: PspA/IM30 family protein [Methylocystis sp.]|nr:PspA/IM30 family protein [Methylocystis sp.]
MFKTIVTLMRGQAFDAEQRLKDQNALSLLDQQVRDAAGAAERLRRALAIATAQERQEARRLDGVRAEIADLEARAIAALKGAREDLAEKAALALAELEADAAASATAQQRFKAEIAKLDALLKQQTRRLAELARGRRVARAAQAARAARRGGVEPAFCCENTLADAEATLARLREQQAEAEAAEEAFARRKAADEAESVADALAREGFGPAREPRATDILARLKEKAAQ